MSDRLNGRLFSNTQHPATHNPKWRKAGIRGGRPHRECRLCGHVEFRSIDGSWLEERGRCQHR